MEQEATKRAGRRKGYPSLLSRTKGVLRRLDLQARKSLGQHFLIDQGVLETIVQAAGLTPDDVVVEVGPGLGVLTTELVGLAGWVVAVELDSKLAVALKRTLASVNNVTIINGDILRVDPVALLEEPRMRLPQATEGGSLSYKVVANLPYYITSAVIRHFLEASVRPRLMVVMVQKEVAEAIVARPGRMSLLSVSVQFYGEPAIVGYVPAGSFYPPPEVDSAILRIILHPEPVVVGDSEGFFRLVRAAFAAPRKQIANSLAQGLGSSKAEVLPLLEKAAIVPGRRAETLALSEWARLWQVFSQARQPSC